MRIQPHHMHVYGASRGIQYAGIEYITVKYFPEKSGIFLKSYRNYGFLQVVLVFFLDIVKQTPQLVLFF